MLRPNDFAFSKNGGFEGNRKGDKNYGCNFFTEQVSENIRKRR